MKRFELSLFAAALLCCPCVAADYQQTLSHALLNQTAVIRNYYMDHELEFDAEGKLVSPGTPGFGPSDGRIYIEKVELRRDHLTLTGQRTFPVYQSPAGDSKLTMIGDAVTIEIALPPDKEASEVVASLLNRVFVTKCRIAKGEVLAGRTAAVPRASRVFLQPAQQEEKRKAE